MKKAILTILIAGLMLATIFSSVSVMAIAEEEDSEIVGVGSSIVGGGGTVMAEVFPFSQGTSKLPEGSEAYCIDKFNNVHVMDWYSPFPCMFFYGASNLPYGIIICKVKIGGYGTQTRIRFLRWDPDDDTLWLHFFFSKSIGSISSNPVNILQNPANFLSIPQNVS